MCVCVCVCGECGAREVTTPEGVGGGGGLQRDVTGTRGVDGRGVKVTEVMGGGGGGGG